MQIYQVMGWGRDMEYDDPTTISLHKTYRGALNKIKSLVKSGVIVEQGKDMWFVSASIDRYIWYQIITLDLEK